MKNHYKKLKALVAATLFATFAFAGGTAYVQIVHSSPDPVIANVDLWADIGGGQTLLAADVSYLEATGFLPIGTGGSFTLYLKATGSTISSPGIDTLTSTSLSTGVYYQFFITGVEGSGYAANPNSRSTTRQLNRFSGARTTGTTPPLIDILAFHGVTDAPGVDVRVRNGGPLLVNNLKYGDFSSYLQVPPSWYQLEVIVEDSSAVINTWVADVTGISGQAVTIFAAGFATPASNNNGPALGLYGVLANGFVVPLPLRRTSNVQLIHNAADAALDTVDVYVNGVLGFPNLKFRGATPFIPITSEFPIQVGIVPDGGTWADTVRTWTFFFNPDSNYVALFSGVIDSSDFASNPDGISTELDVTLKEGAVIANGNPALVSFNFANGVTDAFGLDARIRSNGPLLFNNTEYKEVNGYLQAPAYYYAWEIIKQDSSLPTPVVTSILNLSTYGGSGIYIFSSGFVTPANNQNGPQFDLFGALPSGQVVAFPRRQTASVQFVNNCADPFADTLDVYINGAKYFPNFAFRNASPVLGIMTANFPIEIGFAPGGSASANDTFWREIRFFSPGETYIGIAQGNVSSGMAANPNGIDNSFDLLVKTPAQGAGSLVAGNFDYFFLNGAPDVATLDVKTMGGSTLFDNVSYGEHTGYIATTPSNSVFELQDSTGTITGARYTANFSGRADQAGFVVASGYMNPAANNNGWPFGLFYVGTGGGPFVPLALYSSINDLNQEIGLNMFPNPNDGTLFINFDLKTTEKVTIDIIDVNGSIVKNVISETVSGKQNMTVDINDLSNGMYFARVTTSEKTSNNKFILVK